jgi:hypothetical protein
VTKQIVKPRATYREITLVIGILVALLVAFTLWYTNHNEPTPSPSVFIPQSLHTASLNLIESLTRILF